MKKVILFCLSFIYLNSMTFATEWRQQVSQFVLVGSTPPTPSSYTWGSISDTEQGAGINLTPTEIVDIYVEAGNAKIDFNHWATANTPSVFICDLSINIDNQGYTNLYEGSAVSNYVWNCSTDFSTVGTHNLKVKYLVCPGDFFDREYNIHVVPATNDLILDGFGNSMRSWLSGDPNATAIVLSEGFDAYNTRVAQYYRSAGSQLVDCLLDQGIDVYIVDYFFNSQALRNNAAVYSSAISYVSTLYDNEDIIAAGISMGGVISRFALAKAENDGTPLPVHTWISLDAPHQGATVHTGLQDYLKDVVAGNDFKTHASDNPAAKTLLVYNSYDQSGSTRTSFMSELTGFNGNGYPVLTHNIGVAFSSPAPNSSSGTWLELDMPWPIPNESFNVTATEMAAGSFLPTITRDPFPVPKPILTFLDITMTQTQDVTFIPYLSALDIDGGGTSPFDETFETAAAGSHDVIPSELMDVLTGVIVNRLDYLFQNQTFTGTETFEARNSIVAGEEVNPAIPLGNVIVEQGADIEFFAGKFISLENGFLAENGSNFLARIQTPLQPDCSPFEFRPEDPISMRNSSPNQNGHVELEVISNHLEKGVAIYPNPTNGEFNIFIDDSIKSYKGVIIDSFGKKVLQINERNNTDNHFKAPLGNVQPGIYFLKIYSQGTEISKKFIVQ